MLLTHAHLISPGANLPNANVRIEDERIVEITEGTHHAAPQGDDPNAELDLGGQMLLPGFFDIHAHGAHGDDVCHACPEALQRIALAKLREGVTTWLPTTLTLPSDRLVEIVQVIAAWADSAPLNIPGIHLEGPFINREQAGAQNPAFVRPPDLNEFRSLHEVFPALILSLAPEIPGSLNLIREATAMGIVTSAAHTLSDYATLMDAVGYGLRHLTHFGNAMTGLHHREIGIVGAGLMEDCLKLEVIADGVHLDPEMLRLIFTRVPRENIMLITDSTSASWLPDGETTLGGLEVIVADGVARLKSSGALAGSTLQFPQGLRLVSEITGEPLEDLVATTSWNQARALGLPDLGKIEPGFRADLTVLNDDFTVARTFVGGR